MPPAGRVGALTHRVRQAAHSPSCRPRLLDDDRSGTVGYSSCLLGSILRPKMRLIARYTAILVALFLVMLIEIGRERVVRDRLEAEEETAHDHQFLGEIMRARADDISEASWATRSMKGAMEAASRVVDGPRLEWMDEQNAAAFAADSHGVYGDTMVSVFPVRAKGRLLGAIRIRESLASHHREMRNELLFISTRMSVFCLLCGILSLVVGRWLVAKPVGLLVAKARKTGRGDFSEPLSLKRSDELGALATEIDAMC